MTSSSSTLSDQAWSLIASGGGFGPELGVLGDMDSVLWSGVAKSVEDSGGVSTKNKDTIAVGSAVVRGPDWRGGSSDGGKVTTTLLTRVGSSER